MKTVGLNSQEAADHLGMHPSTLWRWAKQGRVRPSWTTPGGHARWDLDDLREQLGIRPAEQPIAAAVVVGTSGLLIGQRNDGSPPWTLLAGEVEPGEQPGDTVIREVKEEAGLEVLLEKEIGRRVHPRTQRIMVYLACRPIREEDEANVHIGDPDELADVQWITGNEVKEYLPDLYKPVRRHIMRLLSHVVDDHARTAENNR